MSRGEEHRCGDNATHPRQPGALIIAERDLPGRLQGLEELIGLEEGSDDKGIEKAEGNEEEENVFGGGQRLELSRG